MKNLPNYEEFINEAKLDYTYKEDSGSGKPTMTLVVGETAWEKIKHLFDETGRPVSDDIKKIVLPLSNWSLYAQSFEKSGQTMHKIYGVAGDWTFGNAPTFYQQKYRGNKKSAKIVFDWFIKKYL